MMKNDENNKYSKAAEIVDEKKNQILRYLKSYYADHHTSKGVKIKMLALLNGSSEEKIKEALND